MKKLLLSLAVVAASGGYVAATHLTDRGNPTAGNADAMLLSTPDVPAAAAAVPTSNTAEVTLTLPSAAPVAVTPAPPARRSVQVAELAQNQLPVVPAAASDVVPAPFPARRSAPAAAPVSPAPVAAAAPSPAPAVPQGQYADGTFKGTSANAYYGRVQVEAVVQGGQLASINVLSYPSDRRTSRYINSQALPRLAQEAISAQSADVDTVSGATLTSNAYRQSLAAALKAAGGHGGSGNNA